MKGQKPITAIGTITADTTEQYEHEFEKPAVLTRVKASTYVGQEYALRYYFHKVEDGTELNVLRPIGDFEFLAGNGENPDLPARVEFKPGDTLRVTVENATSGENAHTYHYNARPVVDYDAGLVAEESVGTAVEQAREWVSGVFA